jgi:hypothetical protein
LPIEARLEMERFISRRNTQSDTNICLIFLLNFVHRSNVRLLNILLYSFRTDLKSLGLSVCCAVFRSNHKVRIPKEYQSVCPLVGIGTLPGLPMPLSPASVSLLPEPGGAHSPAGEGLGESQFRRLLCR